MNNVVMRKIVLTASYQKLSSVPLVASVCISCPPGNAGITYFKGDDGLDVPWQPSEYRPMGERGQLQQGAGRPQERDHSAASAHRGRHPVCSGGALIRRRKT